MWQGEPRDSSDEEWEAAYAALDPVQQIGWRNRRGQTNEVGERLVRDVFEAADAVHEHAMSEVDGNTQVEDGNGNVGPGASQDQASQRMECSADPVDGEEVALQGNNPIPGTCLP